MEEERKLAHVVIVGEIESIPGYDRIELTHVLGWTTVTSKGQFKPGDLGIYIEIDSLVPATEPFAFMEKYGYKVKTQKLCKGTVLSQGLLMSPKDFGYEVVEYPDGSRVIMANGEEYSEGDDMTKVIGITYYNVVDRKRKAASPDKYNLMARRNGKLLKHQPFRWLMKREWGRKLLFVFFGRKKDRKKGWPDWVSKTDEERIQNCPQILTDKATKWIATEKIDGTSTTFTMKRSGRKFDFRVCSRNVVMRTPDRKCYYDENVYWKMAIKYNAENVLKDILEKHPELSFVTIQGETFGYKIMSRKYIPDIDFRAFNLIYGYMDGTRKRFNPIEMTEELKKYNIPCVPVVGVDITLPDTVREVLNYAAGDPSVIDGGMREGVVFRNKDATKSFKAVSNEYLIKYHDGDADYLESLLNIDDLSEEEAVDEEGIVE